ncbi:hypothetical protein NPS01_25370 [Nocardioides psychrotolerans]|nr:hypothetical protein NPS01_25370 [Nocardioides psychrotolerans]
MLSLAMLATWRSGGAWADVAGWIEALATLAAFSAAVVAAVVVSRTFEVERARDDRAQASLIAAWTTGETEGDYAIDPVTELEVDRGITFVQVAVRNASPVPVRNVQVRLDLQAVPVRPTSREDSGTTHASRYFGTADIETLPPEDEREIHWVTARMPVDPLAPEFPREHTVRFHLSMRFTDAAGYTWERDHIGRLTRIAAPRPTAVPMGRPDY